MAIILDDNVLKCPKCGGINLQQGQVDVFDRKEDAVSGIHVSVNEQIATVETISTGYPGVRRDNLFVLFYCEECHEVSRLIFAQHKGTTLVEFE